MTEREWVNSLPNAQLMKLFRTFQENPCAFCAYQGQEDCGYCFDGQVEWLEQEHDADRFEERDYRYSYW